MLKINLIQTENIMVVNIPVSAKGYLKEKIEKLNKKAVKFGTKPMKLTFGSDKIVEHKKHKYVTCLAKLAYEIPKINGWELICTFDIVPVGEELEVFTSKVPNKVIPIEWQTIKEIKCDHCGINRFRNHSMLMYNAEINEYKEIGSTCIKDFFGHDPKGFMLFARFTLPDLSGYGSEVEEGMDYEYRGQGYRMGCDNLHELLEMTSACIRKWGWTSATTAYNHGGTSTKNDVMDQLNPPRNWQHDPNFEKLYPDEKDTDIAEKTIEYFLNLSEEEIGTNDYLMNCHKVAKHNMVPWKLAGVACSMINAYQRVVEKRIKEEKFANLPPSGFVGEVGDRLKEIPVTCVFDKELFNEWTGETKTLYIWLDKDGNKYKTFYSGNKWSMSQEDSGLLTGTVKKHDTYNGEKSTLLSRCIVVKNEKE